MTTTLICDLESDGLLDELTRVHMVQIGDANGEDACIYSDDPVAIAFGCRPLADGIRRIEEAEQVVFHGGIKFDAPALNRFYPGLIKRERLYDTVVMARLSDPEERSHALSAWGQRLGILKGDFDGPWDKVTKEMCEYAIQDIHVGRAVWHRVKHVLDWGDSCQLEHDVAYAIDAQERNGFGFNEPAARELEGTLRQEIHELDVALQEAFPPLPMEETFTPKASNSKLGYRKGEPFTKRWLEVFNPGSRLQIEKRLRAMGWKPKSFTPDGRAKLDEEVIAKLTLPGCAVLMKRFRLEKMLGQLSDGKAGWLKAVKNGRIYGRVNPNGACTGRMAHSKPNVAQADKDPRMRSLWIPRPGWKLVGCDAEGLEARMLAHYLARYDGGAFTEMLINGKKEEGTDVHSSNAKACQHLAPIDREGAKTLLYALMYGAGDSKLGMMIIDRCRTLGLKPHKKLPPRELGVLARSALAKSMVGIDKLTADIRKAVKVRGYFKGLDGRHVKIRSEHSALNTLLQGAGAIVMKKALVMFVDNNVIRKEEMGTRWGLCANVHDEVQIECEPDIAEDLGRAFANCIEAAGAAFNLKCPLAGKAQVGDNWSETH